MKIENAKTTFFNSKEEYLTFRKNWAVSVNSLEAKKKLFEGEHGTRHVDGYLSATQHFVYLFLCGKDVTIGFTPVTNKVKLDNGARPNRALEDCKTHLGSIARDIKYVIEKSKPAEPVAEETPGILGKLFGKNKAEDKYAAMRAENEKRWLKSTNERIDEFLAPFGGSVTRSMILNLDEAVQIAWNEHWAAKKKEAA